MGGMLMDYMREIKEISAEQAIILWQASRLTCIRSTNSFTIWSSISLMRSRNTLKSILFTFLTFCTAGLKLPLLLPLPPLERLWARCRGHDGL